MAPPYPHACCPSVKGCNERPGKKDIHRLIGCQASFNDEDLGKRKINSWEIKELDFESKEGYLLQDYIMAIPHPDNVERSLFHSVDHL
jgi:hypothetical protein